MELFKKKDRSPHRHIGMALVPPAAFTAVPNSPPPTPVSKKKKKKKVVISPIVPALIGAAATARAVALGSADTTMHQLMVTYEDGQISVPGRDFIDEDETYAKITHKSDATQMQPAVAGPSRRFTGRPEVPTTHRESIPVRRDFTDEVYAAPHKKTPGALQKETKKRKPNSPRRVVEKPITSAPGFTSNLAPPSSFDHEEVDGFSDALIRKQEEMEERMKLKDEETREMILNLMQDVNSSPFDKRGESAKLNTKDVANRLDHVLEGRSRTEEEHELIKDIASMLKGQSMVGAEGVVLKQQIQEIIDENEVLKETVERLNVELSRYQANFGLDPDDVGAVEGLPSRGAKPKWMTDVRYLSPLFASYDYHLDAKDNIIARHEQQFTELGKQMEEILKENEILRAATKTVRAEPFITQQKWDNVKDQNHLMVEEIQLQLEQLELMERKAKEMHVNHVEEVAKLSKRYALSDAQYHEAENARKQLKSELNELAEKYDRLVIESKEKVPAQEYARLMQQCKDDVENIKEQSLKNLKETLDKVKESQKEKSEAMLKVTEMHSLNRQVQGEIEALKEGRKSLIEKLEDVQHDLEAAEHRELECQLHLAQVMRVAERATSERATYAAVAEKEQKTSEQALRQSMREKYELGRMEESLKHCKLQIASHNKETNERLREVEETHSGQLLEYERKMKHLQKLLHQKQQALEDMANNKRQIENELETVWQAASSENRRIMEALHRSN